MEKNYKVFPGTKIGNDVTIGDYSLIGVPSAKQTSETDPTTIGDNSVIRSHTVIYHGNTIGKNFQTGHHVMIREQGIFGDNVSIGTNSVIEFYVTLGNKVRVHSNCFIPEYTKIEDNAWIGPNVVFTNAKYPRGKDVKEKLVGVTVKAGAKIGANSTILPGITIGENALVGAGSVVTKNVPAGKVVVGNPARIINDVNDIPDYTQ